MSIIASMESEVDQTGAGDGTGCVSAQLTAETVLSSHTNGTTADLPNNDSEKQSVVESVSTAVLLQMITDQKDVISMMQIQMDMQAERLNSQEKLLQELKTMVEKKTASSTSGDETINPLAPAAGQAIEKGSVSAWLTDVKSSDSLSVADMVKKAAEETLAYQAAAMGNYVYDETSGLYYDPNSGYYYDAAQGLFYNGHTRTYYVFDQESQSYVFHSQLPEPEVGQTTGLKKKLPSKKKAKTKIKKTVVNSKIILSPVASPNHECQLDSNAEKETSATSVNLTKSSKSKPPLKSIKLECENASPSIKDIEEGELSSSSNDSSSLIGEDDNDAEDNSDTDADTVTSQASHSTTDSRKREESLPCIRAIIMDASLPTLSKGFLYIVTCMGGSVGREGSMHSILIPDPSISKHHAGIHFSNEDGNFYITDLGSQNGTFLNGCRLSDPGALSEAHPILHGSTLKVGSTTLLIHIHPGSFTCGLCEPGLITVAKEPLYGVSLTKEKKEVLRKKQLKKLRQKYGVEKHETESLSKLPDVYKDRAIERRVNKGSDNPYEKTQVASANVPIKEDNKGFRMLAKMGWNTGDALGRSPTHDQNKNTDPSPLQSTTSQSLLEPINVEMRPGRVGLGFPTDGNPVSVSTLPVPGINSKSKASKTRGRVAQNRAEIAEKTLKRFNEARDMAGVSTSATAGICKVEVIDVD